MKSTTSLLFLVLALISVSTVNAQLALQHRFVDEIVPFNLSNGDTWYREISLWEDSVMTVYKPDFTVYKDIELPCENYASDYFNVTNLSDKLFNNDAKLEYLLTYYVASEYNEKRVVIANEDGEILQDFGIMNYVYPEVHARPGKSPLLLIYHTDLELQAYLTDIYFLPGSSLSVPESNQQPVLFPSPNPATSTIDIPYKVTGTCNAVLTICNAAGKIVERHILDTHANKLSLDVSTMPKGVYIYNYGDTSGKFIVQ